MDENATRAEYRPAPDFHPYDHLYAIKGIAEALHARIAEGPAVEMRWPPGEYDSLLGLVCLQEKLAQEFHEWLVNIENLTTIHLPMTAEDFEKHHVKHCRVDDAVKERRAVYAVK